NKLIGDDRRVAYSVYAQPGVKAAESLLGFTATTLGASIPPAHDVATLTMPLREVKDSGEIDLLKKASTASIAAQREMMKSVKAGVTERTIAGKMTAAWLEQGCERPSYAPIVGTGTNSTTLHYSANSATIADGDVVVVDAACEYSMYA